MLWPAPTAVLLSPLIGLLNLGEQKRGNDLPGNKAGERRKDGEMSQQSVTECLAPGA